MPLKTVYIVRHGEKPEDETDIHLSPRGATRAAALGVLFDHSHSGGAYAPITSLYATASSSKSRRPVETLEPLQVALSPLVVDDSIIDGDEDALVGLMHASKQQQVALVAWHHARIRHIAIALGVVNPPQWQGDNDVFDRIWLIDLTVSPPKLQNLPQRLLYGDDEL